MKDNIRTRPATDEYRKGLDRIDWTGNARRKKQVEDFLDGTGPEDFPGTDEGSHLCSKAIVPDLPAGDEVCGCSQGYIKGSCPVCDNEGEKPDPPETKVILCSVCRFFRHNEGCGVARPAGWCGYHARAVWVDSDCDQGELWTDPQKSGPPPSPPTLKTKGQDYHQLTGPCPICACKLLQCKACGHTIDLRTQDSETENTECETPSQKQD